ncbi:MAG: RidA family protein [Pseudomonadota bacterium]
MSENDFVFDASEVSASGQDATTQFRRAGDFVFVSGLYSPAGESIQAQTRACIQQLSDVLEDAGGSLENLVEVTTYLARMTDFAGYNEAYGRLFSVNGPARTTVSVEQLGHPDALIEMRGVAYIAANTTIAT